MPAAYNMQQKNQISQFSSFTKAGQSIAARFLKANGWNVEQAPARSSSSSTTAALNKLFDQYRAPIKDDPIDSPDTIGLQSAMKYLGDLGLSLDELAVLGVAELLQSPTMGEFPRDGFVNGWKSTRRESIQKQREYVEGLRTTLPKDADLFKRVYRHTFIISRTPGQKSLGLEVAAEYWRLLFGPTGWSWGVGGGDGEKLQFPWLDWWVEFVTSSWKRAVGKDMWNMLEAFARKTNEDETLSWWSDTGAWPGVIDDFVGWVKAKEEYGASTMDIS
ncbi:MAG: Scaffold-type E3 ligase [Cirrosporium novae-zelandiae]|nr:MAG: Scaffold-type E3 ligase [Cirrosporium novae-zelandiae]